MKLKCLGLLAILCMARFCAAESVDFNSATWAVNGPYSLGGLKGKAAILYFYEAG